MSEYILRLSPREFSYVFLCVIGNSDDARRRSSDRDRDSAEGKLIQAMMVGDTGNGGTVRCDELPMLSAEPGAGGGS